MSDATKRLRPSSPELGGWENAIHIPAAESSGSTSSGYDAAPSQEAVRPLHAPPQPQGAPTAALMTQADVLVPQPGHPGVTLPDGIPSVQRWSQTLYVLPKVKNLQASYSELVQRSRTNEDLRNYLLIPQVLGGYPPPNRGEHHEHQRPAPGATGGPGRLNKARKHRKYRVFRAFRHTPPFGGTAAPPQ